MKQKLFIKIIALALCTAFLPVQAADVRQSDTADVLLVSGNSYQSFEKIPVLMLSPGVEQSEITDLISSGGDISGKIIFSGTAVADGNGKLSYAIPIGTDTEKNIYQIYVSGEKHEVGFEKNETRINIVDEIADAGELLSTVLDENYMYLSVDNQMYKACSGSSAIAKILNRELDKKPISSASENALAALAEMIDQCIFVVAANEKKLTSLEQLDEQLSEETNTKEVLALTEQITKAGKEMLLNDVQGNSFHMVSDADERYAKEIVLKAICYPTVKTSKALLEVLNTYNSVLGLDLSDFEVLAEPKRAEAIVEFSGEKPTIATMQNVFDKVVSKYNKKTPTTASGSGGGGGGGGNYIVPSLPNTSVTPAPSAATQSVFKDLSDVAWAKEAILTLHAKGIISGYGNGSFAPNNNIKREEFIKLVVGAYYPGEATGAIEFADVEDKAWYYNSVAIAVNQGIVSGIDEKSFGTGMNITRQDMAVILYRVAGGRFTVKDTEKKFDDDASISDYAKDAVYALRDAGIINGVSDTEFAPDKNATRAETAVMLYRFMNAYGGGV